MSSKSRESEEISGQSGEAMQISASGETGQQDPKALRPSMSGTNVDLRSRLFREHMEAIRGSNGDGQSKEDGKGIKRIESAPDLRQKPEEGLPKVTIGVCAMDKKANSKQMRAIIQRLIQYGEFEVIAFGDETILHKQVEDWPIVQCLLSWHSEGFPLLKAKEYVLLRKPYLINDVFAQDILLDRRKVYRKLIESGIPVPHHIIVDRDNLPQGKSDPDGFIETEDYVELNGVKIDKPFVEKPASGENHNIYIYYPHSMGGGVKRLFRKVDNRSADYDPKHPGTVRRDGSYIYEEFLTTGGTDVKVYTVGPRYAHAEARKSPVVDGKVQRTADGKEVRYPVLLSPQEKEIARSVCLAFGQRVCGFDLLRSERGRSYVCDVNGWSFVKNSQKYYDDAAGIMRMTILSAVAPHRLLIAEASGATAFLRGCDATGESDIAPESMEDTFARGMHMSPSFDDVRSPAAAGEADDGRRPGEELRCVLAVIRHGDRTPKQKMKMVVTQKPMLDLFHKYIDSKGKQAKLKSPNELQELLDVTRGLLEEMEADQRKGSDTNPEADELREKFRIVKTVLEQGGQFAGINRKVQLKPLKWSNEDDPSSKKECTEALLILKHGGVLTHAGRQQAEALGSLFRNVMYPQNGPTGGGLLRLHSTYRHDLKIYSSDEGRVQTSAAAFAKGLLDLEGAALTPILVSLVNKDAGMLDAFGKGASVDIKAAKEELYAQMTYNAETRESKFAMPEYSKPAKPTPPASPIVGAETLGVADYSSSETSRTQSLNGGSVTGAGRPDLGIPGTFSEESGPAPPGSSHIEGRPHIFPMPADPLSSLRRLNDLVKNVVDQLRQKCLEESKQDGRREGYSALTMDPEEWQQQPGQPCGGEKLLLMFDRWRKLTKAFFSEKKGFFDISKIPDIYDAAKYDSIHNANLALDGLEELYTAAKELAAAVIPNEYGLQPLGKLRIGSTICANLLGKLLADLASMRDESMSTAGLQHYDDLARSEFAADLAANMSAFEDEQRRKTEEDVPIGAEDDPVDDGDDATMHRLCPTYAQDVNSPLRHVRTRIYFTSESHCHSLINVLRFCQVALGSDGIIGPTGQDILHHTPELDYMTHVVLRMFENKTLPLRDPGRFRVEILFSPGAAHNPYEIVPLRKDHVIPIVPRTAIHKGDEGGVTLQQLEQATKPYAKPFKRNTDPYVPLQGTRATSQASEKLDFWI